MTVNAFYMLIAVGGVTISAIRFGRGDKEGSNQAFMHSLVVMLGLGILTTLIGTIFSEQIGYLLGANPETASYVANILPKYTWGFMFMSLNTIYSAYMYSTKRTTYAIILNVIRSFIFTTLITLTLPHIFGGEIAWYTFGIYETLSFLLTLFLLKLSERNGIIYK